MHGHTSLELNPLFQEAGDAHVVCIPLGIFYITSHMYACIGSNVCHAPLAFGTVELPQFCHFSDNAGSWRSIVLVFIYNHAVESSEVADI